MTGIIAQNVGRTSGLIKAASGGGGGVWTLIKTLTASADSDLSFVDGTDDVVLDSTYPIYVFKTINAHPSDDQAAIAFQANAVGGSGYNETITSSIFQANHAEADDSASVGYHASYDQAQGTGFQRLYHYVGNDNDQSTSGELWLFGLSSTTYVKHFISRGSMAHAADYAYEYYVAGYFNTTSAIDEIQFKFTAGTIDSGKIKLYGLKDSA
jgi:hypothetical protein